jgi:5-methylcytosine-specific restriction endonuclease McrA
MIKKFKRRKKGSRRNVRRIVTYRSGTGATKHVHSFHGIVSQLPSIKSPAALYLLNQFYLTRDVDYLADTHNKRIQFSRDYLSDQLAKCGTLTCKYCGKKDLVIEFDSHRPIPKTIKATIDHIIPISKGGEIYDVNNIAIACARCNARKSDLLPEDFEKILELNREKEKKYLPKPKQLEPAFV